MVKKILLLFVIIMLFSSCAFFGSSMFPVAMSERISWLTNGNITQFYILDNNQGQEYLFLVQDNQKVAIFDLSLNFRGYIENGINGGSTDGIGFVDFNGDFIIGQNKILKTGSTDILDFVAVPGLNSNSYIYRWTNAAIDYYVKVDNTSNITAYDDVWTTPVSQPMPNGLLYAIPQSEPDLSDVVFADNSSGNIQIYKYNKQDLYDHANNIVILPTTGIPDHTIDNFNLTQWATRCSEGFFVSSNDGEFILYDETGDKIDSIENNDYRGSIVTIDYDSKYYYLVDENDGRIIKERLPF